VAESGGEIGVGVERVEWRARVGREGAGNEGEVASCRAFRNVSMGGLNGKMD